MSPAAQTPAFRGLALGAAYRMAAMACFACMAASVKWAGARGIPVLEMVFFRSICGFLPLGLHIWRTDGMSTFRTKRPLNHIARALFGVTSMGLGFAAFQHLALTEATALQFTGPLFMTALSALVLHEVVGRHRWAAVITGFIGILIMVQPEPGHMNLIGALYALGSAVFMALAQVAIRQMAGTEKATTMVFWYTVIAGFVGLVGSAFHWVWPDGPTLAVLICGGLAGGIGQQFTTSAVREAPLGLVAPFDYTQLVWAALLGFLIFGDVPRAVTLIGAAVVAASGLYILHREFQRYRLARAG